MRNPGPKPEQFKWYKTHRELLGINSLRLGGIAGIISLLARAGEINPHPLVDDSFVFGTVAATAVFLGYGVPVTIRAHREKKVGKTVLRPNSKELFTERAQNCVHYCWA